jgi:cysteine desulfurase
MQVGNSIYLDYQATTPVDPFVKAAMDPFYMDAFANPHSTAHILGQQSADAVEQARSLIEQTIGAKSEEVIFTSGATESNNQAIATVIQSNTTARNKILVSAIEHKCIKNAGYYFASLNKYQYIEIPVLANGEIDQQAYRDLLDDQVLLVCIMSVNNEIGTVQDIKLLAEQAHDVGALFHCDAAQAPQAVDIDVVEWGVDMLSLSAHKVYGPKGIGALYIKNRLQATLPPFIHGGGQQFGMRSGTLAPALCVGFAKAMALMSEDTQGSRAELAGLRSYFIEQLNKANIEFVINGNPEHIHPGNLNLQFAADIDATQLINDMQPFVCASTGSACNSEMVLASHVLKSIGLTDEQAKASIRFSLGRFTNQDQITSAVAHIQQALAKFK